MRLKKTNADDPRKIKIIGKSGYYLIPTNWQSDAYDMLHDNGVVKGYVDYYLNGICIAKLVDHDTDGTPILRLK